MMAAAEPGSALPREVLSLLPRDPAQQLQLAHGIVCHAYSSRVEQLELDNEQLQAGLMQSQQAAKQLERRLGGLEAEVAEHQQRARQALTEQHKLLAEKNALIETVKRLNRDVARLEHFKRNLLQQLQDDCLPGDDGGLGGAYAAVDATSERLVTEVLHSADGIAAAAGGAGGHYQPQPQQQRSNYAQQQQQWSPPSKAVAGKLQSYHTSPRGGMRSAATSGKEAAVLNARQAGHPAAGSGGGASPRGRASGGGGLAAAAAAAPRFASPPHGAGAAGRPSSAAAAVAHHRAGLATSPRIDGKEFFKQARARLSYEQFSCFLEAIKDLNAGRSSREETLGAARQLFGAANADLYGLFEGLLMRHLTSL